ncbi:hypothetical protein [Bradyrhizobium cenepequi]|uniref:hypothetical protein n=1 Tax=Bradyrhizobium cenepequi TaxID=2821403 RepID=UPI001CE32E0B|nr:hypothetical protein [Bradyrhizobium cenepequi]MCA6108174.1 hypothetical protein [Bradyrhizobium cenepequi]
MTGFYVKKEPKWDWRKFLTEEEVAAIAEADAAKVRWQELNKERSRITNRALQRAKYAEQHGESK